MKAFETISGVGKPTDRENNSGCQRQKIVELYAMGGQRSYMTTRSDQGARYLRRATRVAMGPCSDLGMQKNETVPEMPRDRFGELASAIANRAPLLTHYN